MSSKLRQHRVCFWKFSMVRFAVKAGMDLNLRIMRTVRYCSVRDIS